MARILPNNATPIERGLEGVASEVLAIPVEHHKLWNPDTCPATHLHILAATFGVEVWNADWTVETKRAVIKATPPIKRRKGTRFALETAINALAMGAVVKEWFEYSGAPYFFKISIRLNEEPFGIGQSTALYSTAIEAKNVRSFLESVEITRAVSGKMFVGAATRGRVKLRHSYSPFTFFAVRGVTYFGAGYFTRQKMRLQ